MFFISIQGKGLLCVRNFFIAICDFASPIDAITTEIVSSW